MRSGAITTCRLLVLTLVLLHAGAAAVRVHADTTVERAPGVSSTAPQGGPSGPGGPCEGVAGIPCEEGLICILPPGLCEYFDLMGTCAELPCPTTYEPVCGCDGITYRNACFAHLLGTAPPTVAHRGVDYEGVCTTDVPAMSGAGAAGLVALLLGTGTLLVCRRTKRRG